MKHIKFKGKLHDYQIQSIAEDDADKDSDAGKKYQSSSSEDEEVGPVGIMSYILSSVAEAHKNLFSPP